MSIFARGLSRSECLSLRDGTLGLIRNAGIEPTISEYLKSRRIEKTLESLIAHMGIRPRDLPRQKGTPYDELGLGADHWTDADLIDQMLKHQSLINRAVTPWGVKLVARPKRCWTFCPCHRRGRSRRKMASCSSVRRGGVSDFRDLPNVDPARNLWPSIFLPC